MTRPSKPHSRARHIGPLLTLLASTAILAAACSGTTDSASASSSTGSAKSDLAYAQCMRAHGIKDFPDPNAGGGFTLNGGQGSDLNQNNPTYQRANHACKSLRPPVSTQQQAQIKAGMLKFAQCMRAHGIKDFPDPSSGQLQIQRKPGGDLDENNPRFQAARQSCYHDMPAVKRGK